MLLTLLHYFPSYCVLYFLLNALEFFNNLMSWYLPRSSYILNKLSFPPGFLVVSTPEHLASTAPGLHQFEFTSFPGGPSYCCTCSASSLLVPNWGIGSEKGRVPQAPVWELRPEHPRELLTPACGTLPGSLLESSKWSFYCPLATSITDLFYA